MLIIKSGSVPKARRKRESKYKKQETPNKTD